MMVKMKWNDRKVDHFSLHKKVNFYFLSLSGKRKHGRNYTEVDATVEDVDTDEFQEQEEEGKLGKHLSSFCCSFFALCCT